MRADEKGTEMAKGTETGLPVHSVGRIELSKDEAGEYAAEIMATMARGSWEAAELWVQQRGARLLEVIAEREALVDAWAPGDNEREARIADLDHLQGRIIRRLNFGFLHARMAREKYLDAERRRDRVNKDNENARELGALVIAGGKDDRAA